MLIIDYRQKNGVVTDIHLFFGIHFKRDWLNNSLVHEMILDVDKTRVLNGSDLESSVLGPISPKELSGGVKTLLCMLFKPNKLYYGSGCGDNCSKWILEIADNHSKANQDVTISLFNHMHFEAPFTIRIKNTGEIVTCGKRLAVISSLYSHESSSSNKEV